VLETGDPALLAAARSVLQGAGVPYLVTGEGLQNLEGGGVLGAGYNPIFGAARVQVPAARAAEARALLTEEAEPAADGDAPMPAAEAATSEPGEARRGGAQAGRWGNGFAQGLGVGLMAGILAGLAIFAAGRLDQDDEEAGDGTAAVDTDGDGRPDHWAHYEDGVLVSMASDLNFDGKRDSWTEFDRNSRPTAAREDRNFDGKADSFIRYVDGRPTSMEEDSDFDGKVDRWTEFGERGLIRAQKEDSNGDGRPDWWNDYDDAGQIRAERADTDFDGTPDEHFDIASGWRVAGRRDTDFDGEIDVTTVYRYGQRQEATWAARPGVPARLQTFRHGTFREELRDRDGDGAWDLRVVYDPFEYPVEEIELP
jgi:hypothetical protein